MGWEALIPLIINEGIPVAEALWKKWSSGTAPTQADWDELNALAKQRAKDRALQALVRAGILPDDPRAKQLLDLVGGA